jgi:beta-galactosidase GanA
MKLQQRSIAYKFVPLEDACMILYWELYIDEDDFPNNPEIRKKWLTIHVKQHQFLKGKYKDRYNTMFWSHTGKPWDHKIKDKTKQLVIQKVEKFIQTHEDSLTGQINTPLIAQYKTGENDQSLTLWDNVKLPK